MDLLALVVENDLTKYGRFLCFAQICGNGAKCDIKVHQHLNPAYVDQRYYVQVPVD